MPRKTYVLGGVEFSTKAKIKQYIQLILKTTPERDFIGSVEKEVVLDLLQWHPQAKEKIGAGVDAIQVVRHKSWSPAPGFSIHRVDGTVIDFSYNVCLEPSRSDHKTSVKAAFRNALVGQVSAAKHELIAQNVRSDGLVWSQADNQWLPQSKIELDHHPAKFADLMEEFLERRKLTLNDVAIADDGIQPHLANDELKAAWEIFHQDNAEYRLISASLNSKLGKRTELPKPKKKTA